MDSKPVLSSDEFLKLSKRALDVAADPCMWADRAGRIVYANEAACRGLGYTNDELLSMRQSDFDTYYDEIRYVQAWDEVKRTGSLKAETVYVRKDGSRFPVEISVYFLGDEYMGNFVRDITERKRAEEAVRKSEKFLSSIFNCIQDGISILDKDLNIVATNHVLEKWHPYMMPIVGKKCYYAYHTRDSLCPVCPSIKALKEKSMQSAIVPFSAEAGQRGWLEIYAYPMVDEQGNVTGVVEHVRDITERKRAEEALRRSEEGLKKSQEIAHLGNWELDLVNNKLTWSDEVYRIFGLQPQEFGATYEAFLEAVHPDDRAMVDAAYSNSIREGHDSYEIEHRVVRKSDGRKSDGGVHVVYEKCEHIRDKSGRIIRSMGMVHDITERKQVEEAFKEAKAQAELYVDLMGHDINNMNQISMGFLELAHNIIEMNGKLGEDNIVLLDKATDALKDSSQLIDSVRKIQREKMGMYEPQVLDVSGIIDDAVEHFDRIPGRDVKITYDQYKHFLVKANSLLKDVFINLIGNAIKHSRGPLAINIHISPIIDNGKKYCRVEVEDDGPGIPDNLKSTLFDRLNLTTTRAKGKGFGLCLIKMLVDDYLGKFWVEDRVQGDHTKGARFVVLLPAVGEQ